MQKVLHKTSNNKRIGESWEISDVEGNVSKVANGPLKGKSLKELLRDYKGDLVGETIYHRFQDNFPLLIKFIDAHSELSVQVHPDDSVAGKRHNSFGKTEMWYVLQADKNAKLNIGFQKTISKNEFLESLNTGRITQLLHFEPVNKGDAYFIQPGKVHAIGAGVLLAEIQQTSDITYRIYDWDRTDEHGNGRELHTDLALDSIDFEYKEDYRMPYSKKTNSPSNIVKCNYFTANYLKIEGRLLKDFSNLDCFVIYMCVSGKVDVTTNGNLETIEAGETVLIPAENTEIEIKSSSAELLEIYV